MWDFNQVILQGRVTDDVRLKETVNNRKYCWFTVANNAPKKNEDGTFGEYANFFNLTIFDDYAVKNQPKLFKGRKVLIVGRLVQNKWFDTNGGKHDEIRIRVEKMIFDPLSREEKIKHGLLNENENIQEEISVYETTEPEIPVPEIENPYLSEVVF